MTDNLEKNLIIQEQEGGAESELTQIYNELKELDEKVVLLLGNKNFAEYEKSSGMLSRMKKDIKEALNICSTYKEVAMKQDKTDDSSNKQAKEINKRIKEIEKEQYIISLNYLKDIVKNTTTAIEEIESFIKPQIE